MKNIDNIKDNEYMTDEYIDQEIIADNNENQTPAEIAHDLWYEVISNDDDTNDVGDSIWSQVLSAIVNEIRNGLDEEIAAEVREIIWENYVPEQVNYRADIEHCYHKCGDCKPGSEECEHDCCDCGYFDGGNCLIRGCFDEWCACDCMYWDGGE